MSAWKENAAERLLHACFGLTANRQAVVCLVEAETTMDRSALYKVLAKLCRDMQKKLGRLTAERGEGSVRFVRGTKTW